jgi:uncharacterized protein (DUF362 family)
MATSGAATVAIAHTTEKHRSMARVFGLVRDAIDLLGGISRFVKPGQTVLIKPNLTVFYSAEEGCTTDPLVVGALVRLARQAGAARVQVAESSGESFSTLSCMRITGVAAIAEREGAELVISAVTPSPTAWSPSRAAACCGRCRCRSPCWMRT